MSKTETQGMVRKTKTKTTTKLKKDSSGSQPSTQPQLNSQAVKKSTKSSKTVKKIKATIKNYFKLSKQGTVLDKARTKFLEENQALLDICTQDKNIPYATESFLKVIDALEKYAKSTNDADENTNTTNAMEIIKKYIMAYNSPANDKELELLERVKSYSYFLEMKTDGSLSGYEHKKGEKLENPDAGMLNMWKDASDQKLFTHEPNVNDIQQRRTEDCYMLSSLSSIALLNPHLIKQSLKDNGDGTVTVRFYDNAQKEYFYTNKSYNELSLEENADIKLLTKFASMFQSKKDIIDKYISKKNQELEVEFKEKSKEKKTEELDDSDELDIDLSDFLEDLENLKSESSPAPTINSKVSIISNMFNSNSASWYSELFTKCLSSDSMLKSSFTKLLDNLKADSVNEDTVIEQFLKDLIDNGLTDNLVKINRDMTAEQQEYKKVYVTVSKEISTIGGVVEKHAANSLWVQMIEKAYVLQFGKNKSYKDIALNQSSLFLNRFLNKPYSNGKIMPNNDKPITEGETTLISNDKLKVIFDEARNLTKDKNLNIENIMKVILSKPEFSKYSDKKELIIEQLENKGIMHKEFSGIYSSTANDVFNSISENLANKNTITVGINSSQFAKERKKALNSSGIRTDHAYAILDAFETEGHKFVTLRDPYGLFRREYEKNEYTDGQYDITKKDASKFTLKGTDTMGAFNMELNDFLATFNEYSGILK